MNRYVRVHWFQYSPTRTDPLLPSWLCRVCEMFVCMFSVLWCSIWLCQLYKFLLSINNAYGWKMYFRASTDGSLSLFSLSHTHAQVGPVELFLRSWQLLIRFHCTLIFFLKLLIKLSDFKKLYRSLVWAFPASLNVWWEAMLGCTVLHRPFFQHQQCNWADSCTQSGSTCYSPPRWAANLS